MAWVGLRQCLHGLAVELSGREFGAEPDELVRAVAVGLYGRSSAPAQRNCFPVPRHGAAGWSEDLKVTPNNQGPVRADHD